MGVLLFLTALLVFTYLVTTYWCSHIQLRLTGVHKYSSVDEHSWSRSTLMFLR